jgi:glycosyltransferase involved in cell wall biosynthesis
MLLKDPVLRQRMGENGRKYVLEDRSWESVARKVAKVCEDAIQAHKKHNI